MNNSFSRKDASRIIRRHLIKTIPLVFEIQEGVPKGCLFYNMPEDEPCWTAHIPSQKPMIGSARYICISKKSGKVIYDGSKGE
ncbi:MAG: hypothetical protein WC373_02155 [Smithella sp.]